jgi:NifU-like protein involved in Fe-S cluster formation
VFVRSVSAYNSNLQQHFSNNSNIAQQQQQQHPSSVAASNYSSQYYKGLTVAAASNAENYQQVKEHLFFEPQQRVPVLLARSPSQCCLECVLVL